MDHERGPIGRDDLRARVPLARAVRRRGREVLIASLYDAGDRGLCLAIERRDDSIGGWTAKARCERVIDTLWDSTLVVAGRLPGTSRVEVGLDGRISAVAANEDDAWIAILEGVRAPYVARARSFDGAGRLIDTSVLELTGDSPRPWTRLAVQSVMLSFRARFGLLPKGSTAYAPIRRRHP